MSRFHIATSGKPAPCNASLKACPRGGPNDHFDSLEEAVVESTRREATARREARKAHAVQPIVTPIGNEGQQVVGGEGGPHITEQDYLDALEERELSERDFARYLHANNFVFVTDAVRAKVREKDAMGWSDYADPHLLTTEDRHQIALLQVAVDADKWRDEDEDRLRPSDTGQYFAGGFDEPAALRDDFVATNRAFLEKHAGTVRTFRNHEEEIELIVSWKNEHGGTEQRTYAPGADIAAERGEARQRVESRVGTEQLRVWEADSRPTSRPDDRDPRHPYGAPVRDRSENNGLDPEFIETLKKLYLAKFGVHSDEDGVDAGALLAMFNNGELG